ncbi:MAG: hypothetical protein ABII09_01635 [Planctomycetota bacterium]
MGLRKLAASAGGQVLCGWQAQPGGTGGGEIAYLVFSISYLVKERCGSPPVRDA